MQKLQDIRVNDYFVNIAQAGRRAWDLLVTSHFRQHGYCSAVDKWLINPSNTKVGNSLEHFLSGRKGMASEVGTVTVEDLRARLQVLDSPNNNSRTEEAKNRRIKVIAEVRPYKVG